MAALMRLRWADLTDRRSQRVVEIAEQYADRDDLEPEMWRATKLSQDAWEEMSAQGADVSIDYSHKRFLACGGHWMLPGKGTSYQYSVGEVGGYAKSNDTLLAQFDVVWDILNFSHLLRPIENKSEDTKRLAWSCYNERMADFKLCNDKLSILSDSLEEDGCTDDRLLNHLREVHSHYLGCWALDHVLEILI